MRDHPLVEPLSMEECEFYGIPKATCAHCLGTDIKTKERDEDLEVKRVFEAKYNGRCNQDYDHKIRVGDKVGILQHAGNPLLPIPGVACSTCYLEFPEASPV